MQAAGETPCGAAAADSSAAADSCTAACARPAAAAPCPMGIVDAPDLLSAYSLSYTTVGRYSPTLSRRCTHLAVPGGTASAAATCSDKLRSAWRNRHKWGLQIVDLR